MLYQAVKLALDEDDGNPGDRLFQVRENSDWRRWSDEIASEQAAVESPSVEATSARMPLPNAVIARTIGRIGYPCGQVASTTAMDGASGAFKVTCTSGHSYRAAPVRGRYRFRRLG